MCRLGNCQAKSQNPKSSVLKPTQTQVSKVLSLVLFSQVTRGMTELVLEPCQSLEPK